ncbi:MAG: hypothetical protein GTN80_00020 [Nitrososphaeria archaeon]|nr:hypothetical protein [Nitrososphaeria archaeon]NIQ32033.1 hypothetical protein [Nitrososphaeria archaeon]
MATSSWDPILYTKIKTAEQKDLVIQFTAECALLTDTKIKGKGNEEVSSMDTASVRVRVKIDGELAFPEDVTLCERMQTLKGKLSEWIIETNETTGEPYLVEVSEEIELILNTTSANGFNFLAFNVGSGVHEVVLEADIYINDQPQEGVDESYPTAAVIGDRTLVVDEIRLVQSQTSP